MPVPRALRLRWLPILGVLLGASTFAHHRAGPVEQPLLKGLVWRNIGPFRAGRVTAVTGAIGVPGTYYMGLPAGGVWKTTSAGVTWFPVFDDVKEVASIGAVEVAPSNPNVVYVGTGSTGEGNGMYKSTDGGHTWQHLGLDSTRQIPSMIVDETNPDVVVIAAEGSSRSADGFHGIFRTTDGGRTWTRTLFVENTIGATDLARAWDRPDIMLAATIRRRGGFGGGGGGGGANQGPSGTKLFKSTDAGVTWTEITGGGLPPLTGRLSVAIAQHTDAQRMYVIGPTAIGLWRSDDGGATWRRMAASDVRIANGQGNYSSGVWVNTGNPDTVYTTATTVYRSTDGGSTFVGWKGSPGGDDPQVMWLDPTDPRRMFLGVDQGATISQDGGENWSTWYNQSTEQIYHIAVDNQFPYWVYGTQQDACAVMTRSRGDYGQINPIDWMPNPGFERGWIAPDPLNAKTVYALNMTAGIMKMSYPSGQWINISPNIDTSLGLRANGDQPLAFNASDPHELMAGFQMLMATTDAGMHWRKISPDLTVLPNAPAPATPPAAGRGGGGFANLPGTITALSSSAIAAGTIWVGTSNGNIQVTRNHGASWQNVSIPDVRGAISSVDASHQEAGTAFVALRAGGEWGPSFYRTHDYGHTWTRIIDGMRDDQPGGSWARVIRGDTKQAGLLFAGTESSIYVSFDDGDHWQSLMLNLPTSSYRDMVIKDNDLVVCTYGRGVFILDDISPLRQMTTDVAAEAAHLFKPGDAVRVRRNENGDTPFPPEVPHAANPPLGAVIYYTLARPPQGEITLEISDAAGNVVRHLSSAPIPPIPDAPPPVPPFWLEVPRPMPTEVGLNRINWDIRYDHPPAFNHNYAQVMGATPGGTAYTPEGPLALPGVYTLKLTVDGTSYTQTLTVRPDPRSPATPRDLEAQHALQMKLYAGARESWDGWHQAQAERDAIADVLRRNPPAEVSAAAMPLDSMLAKIQGSTTLQTAGRFGRQNAPSGTFASLNGTEPGESDVLSSMNGQLRTTDYGDLAPSEAMLHAYASACTDLREAIMTLRTINGEALVSFNQVLTRNNLAPIAAPSASLPLPSCTAQPAAARTRGRPSTDR